MGLERTEAAADEAPSAMELSEFQPLLALPHLHEAQRALEESQFARALEVFEAQVEAHYAERAKEPAFSFQRGRLSELAGELKRALSAYEDCAAVSWELQAYCRYLAARTASQDGRAERALELLEALLGVAEPPLVDGARHLYAEVAVAEEQWAKAAPVLRQLLREDDRPAQWERAALLFARVQLELTQDALTPESLPVANHRRLSNADRSLLGSLPGKASAPARERAPLAQQGGAPTNSSLGGPQSSVDGLMTALSWVRRVALERAGRSVASEAVELEQQILARLPADHSTQLQVLTAQEQLVRLEALVKAGRAADAQLAADELLSSIPSGEAFSDPACEARLLKNKALALTKAWGRAVDLYGPVLERCQDRDLRARALYLAGRYAQYDKRHAQAIRLFARLEQEVPEHRLADDARLLGAKAYLELGDESSFTRLLSTIVEDYPAGDLALDGAFELALRRIERGDWAGAANVLDRGMQFAMVADRSRDHEYAGRERYFRARAWIETGERERGLAEYEALVRERPLSYYMQHAYSRLFDVDPERAQRVRDAAVKATREQPFRFEFRPEFSNVSFRRALELLRQGELEFAQQELAELPQTSQESTPELLWSMALLYARAGSAKLSHQLARGRLTDWLARWPVGDWRQPWELAFPRPYPSIVAREAKRNELPESIIYAVMREESAFDPRARSPANAYGLMQLIRPTARHFAKKLGLPSSTTALFTPNINIALGARAFKDFQGYFPENPLLAVPGYNAGPGRPRRWLRERPGFDFDVWVELIPFRETRRYTKRVLASRGAYAFLYEPESADWFLPIKLNEPG